MKSILKQALEDANGEVIINATGPLGETYTKALNAIYSKETTPETVSDQVNAVATETQATDSIMMRELANIVSGNTYNQPAGDTEIYGVAKINVDEDDILEVANKLAVQPDSSEFILVIDAMGSEIEPVENNVETKVVDIANQTCVNCLESLAKAYGVKVYSSLGQAIEQFKVRK